MRPYTILRKSITYFRYKLCGGIIAKAWVTPTFLGISNRNFGDDINKPLLEALTGERVYFTSQLPKLSSLHILPIGSILGILGDQNSIVWGSGILYEDKPLIHTPNKICAVRGKLTYQYLLNHNIPCPAVFGDPALLLPYIYKPQMKKKYKYGIIPHIFELKLPHVQKYTCEESDILLIDLQNYKSWQDVIEKINSCEKIISSSLHGLIVADAYHIPNVFAHFSDLVNGGDFKYRDYMSVVGRDYFEPFYFCEQINFEAVASMFQKYQCIDFDPLPLLESFPMNRSPFLQKLIKQLKHERCI